jgi:hypothetical protein
MDREQLSAIFGKYAGEPVGVNTRKARLKIAGVEHVFNNYSLKRDNPALDSLRAEAQRHGLSVSVHLPETMSTCDYVSTRLNVHVEKDAKGKWRIANDFHCN